MTEVVDRNLFSLNFLRQGFLPKFIPVAANFGRTHVGQLGQQMRKGGKLQRMGQNFHKLYGQFRDDIFAKKVSVVFVDRTGKPLGSGLDIKKLRAESFSNRYGLRAWKLAASLVIYLAGRIPEKISSLFKEKNNL